MRLQLQVREYGRWSTRIEWETPVRYTNLLASPCLDAQQPYSKMNGKKCPELYSRVRARSSSSSSSSYLDHPTLKRFKHVKSSPRNRTITFEHQITSHNTTTTLQIPNLNHVFCRDKRRERPRPSTWQGLLHARQDPTGSPGCVPVSVLLFPLLETSPPGHPSKEEPRPGQNMAMQGVPNSIRRPTEVP